MVWSTPRSGVLADGSKATGRGSRARRTPIQAEWRSANSRAALSEARAGIVRSASRLAARILSVNRRDRADRLSATR